MNCLLGIDPGLTGALAFYFPDEASRISVIDMPAVNGQVDPVNLTVQITTYRPIRAIVESAGARPGQGVTSVFKFGRAYGTILGVLGALKIPVQLVTPATWKKHFRLSAEKEASRALAIRTFPECAQHFSRVRDHNRAEAALIARYAAETALRVAA